MKKGFVKIDPERCKGCMLCVKACPFGVLNKEGPLNSEGVNTAFVANVENCTACSACFLVCPDLAIRVYRKDKK